MSAGKYDRLIEILSPQSTQDGEGDEQLEWCVLDTRWAWKREQSGREDGSDPQIAAQTAVQFGTPFMMSTVNTAMRVRETCGTLWEIVGLSENPGPGRRREHKIDCRIVDKLGTING